MSSANVGYGQLTELISLIYSINIGKEDVRKAFFGISSRGSRKKKTQSYQTKSA